MTSVHRIGVNDLTLLKSGADYFPRLCADIDAARHSIYLETYIFAADETGRRVADALQRAVSRGVSVYVLLDGYGSADFPESWIDDLRASGVVLHWYRREISPFTRRRNWKRRLRRMHRKMVAIDDDIAYVGGINIIDDIPREHELGVPRLDYTVRIRGPLSAAIRFAMMRLWEVVSWVALRKRVKSIGWRLRRSSSGADARVSLLLRDNVRHRRDIEHAYISAINGAQREIIIANAYFLPGRTFLRALRHAARRGVRVTLLLQGKVEYRLQHFATLALYDQLLAAGVEIYEYQPSFLHAKVAVVDGEWATVGSFNIDPFSLLLAREANLAIRDAGFSSALRDSLMHAIEQDGRHVMPEQASAMVRIAARISFRLIRFVIGILGIANKH